MSDKPVSDEIQVLTLAEKEVRSEFRGDAMRGLPELLGRLRPAKVKLEELAGSVAMFTKQMEKLLAETPTKLGEFEFAEFEVSAAINAKGELSICGVAGAEAGIEGGLKFVFRKRATP